MALFADSFWSRYHRPFFFLQLKTIAGDNKKYQVEQEPCTGILKGCQFFGGYNRVQLTLQKCVLLVFTMGPSHAVAASKQHPTPNSLQASMMSYTVSENKANPHKHQRQRSEHRVRKDQLRTELNPPSSPSTHTHTHTHARTHNVEILITNQSFKLPDQLCPIHALELTNY